MSITSLNMATFETTYLAVIFVMAIFTGFNGVRGNEMSCGDVTYNATTSLICCGRQLMAQPWKAEGTLDCCGNQEIGTFFFHGQEMCCGSTRRNKTPDLKCCRDQRFYNVTTQTCCGSEVINVSEGKVCCPGPADNRLQGFSGVGGSHQCCGSSGPFRPETELCCEISGQPSVIRQRTSGVNEECCGLNRIDTSTHMCCRMEQVLRDPYLECCGSGTYNVTTEICCRGQAVARGPNAGYECCARQAFNPQNEVCCFGDVHQGIGHGECFTGPNQEASVFQPAKKSVCKSTISDVPKIPGITGCCNKEAYLNSSQMCCNESLFDRDEDLECCGSDTYNKTTHLCCNDLKRRKQNPTEQCCATTTFNPSRKTCCGEQVTPGVGKCCLLSSNTYEVYDEQAQTCCRLMDWNTDTYTGNVYNASASPVSCCGAQLLEPDQLCDNNIPIEKSHTGHDKVCWYGNGDVWAYMTFNMEQAYCDISTGVTAISPGHQVCGGGTFNPTTHLCCDDHVHPRSGADTACCGFKAYDKTEQCCLLGNVFDGIPEAYAGNCRDEAFDNRINTCDINSAIRPIGEVEEYPERCGTEPFHPTDQECCNGVLIGPGFTCCGGVRAWETPGTNLGQGQCCLDARDGSSKGYNSQTHICCQGEVHDNGEQNIECCGTDAYNPADSGTICCGDRRYAVTGMKTECTGTTPHRLDQMVCDGVIHPASSSGSCCGKSLINQENQVCCDGFPYDRESPDTQCCGKLAYDTSRKTCCRASLHEIETGEECCGSVYFNTHDQVCHQSGGEFYVFRSEDEGSLCSEGSYDSTRHTCCQGILHMHITDGQCCGNQVVRYPEVEVCCGGELKQKKGRYTECCGGHMFNPDVYQCCGRKMMPLYSGYRKCCNDRIIRAGEECVAN